MVRRSNVPASVAIAPEAHAERGTGHSSRHRGIAVVVIGLKRATCETTGVCSTIQIPHVIGGFGNPITLVYFITRSTNTGVVTGKNGVSAMHTFHTITNRRKQIQGKGGEERTD